MGTHLSPKACRRLVNKGDLAHEMKIYSHLAPKAPLQGEFIPVCLGSINLTRSYPLVSLAKVAKMMLMSWAGTNLRSNNWPEDAEHRERDEQNITDLGSVWCPS